MSTASIEIAIALVKQAIDQDKKKNYNEAARCYREALILFKGVQKTKGITKGVQQAIELKCNQYEERLKKLDKWILANSDLTHIFKDAVDFHKRPESQISDNSISSETWKDLKHNQLFRQGILAMERGKKRDQTGAYIEALLYYEDGMRLLMEAANQADHNEEDNIELLKFKCLLIHGRIEMIRQHLDCGRPLNPINDSFDTIEYSLSLDSTPEPNEDEESVLRSAELGSIHSLNHSCQKLQKSTSMGSIESDEKSRRLRDQTPQSIPLADLEGELRISSLSIMTAKSMQSIQSYHGSMKNIQNESSHYEADYNITELTIANSGLDLDQYSSDSRSDSGISDQSPKVEQALPRSRHSSSAYASSNEDEAMLQVHRNNDGTLVLGASPFKSSPPLVKLSPSASLKRQKKLDAIADELTVLSQEDVVDVAIKSQTKPNKKEEFVPSRAMAREYEDDEEENFNKGCYYFVACLDSLWIL